MKVGHHLSGEVVDVDRVEHRALETALSYAHQIPGRLLESSPAPVRDVAMVAALMIGEAEEPLVNALAVRARSLDIDVEEQRHLVAVLLRHEGGPQGSIIDALLSQKCRCGACDLLNLSVHHIGRQLEVVAHHFEHDVVSGVERVDCDAQIQSLIRLYKPVGFVSDDSGYDGLPRCMTRAFRRSALGHKKTRAIGEFDCSYPNSGHRQQGFHATDVMEAGFRFLGIATAAMSPWSNMRLTGTAAVAMPFR